MKKQFKKDESIYGYVVGIKYGNQTVLHLVEGTVINEHYIDWILARLNGLAYKAPLLPKPTTPQTIG